MALCKNSKKGYWVAAVIAYAIFSVAWGIHAFFQAEFAWLPWLNLILVLLVCAVTVINLLGDLFSGTVKTYEGLPAKEKKRVRKIGKILGKIAFSRMKEHPGRVGDFCRRWDETM